jgi:hypothetical protein
MPQHQQLCHQCVGADPSVERPKVTCCILQASQRFNATKKLMPIVISDYLTGAIYVTPACRKWVVTPTHAPNTEINSMLAQAHSMRRKLHLSFA